MRKTERNFTNKVLESKRGDVQAVKSKIKSSVMAVAFLFAATMPLTMAVSSRNVQAAVTQQKQIQTVNQKVKTNTSKAIKTITPKKVTSATMIKAYKKYLRKNVSNKKYYAIVNIGDNNAPVLLRGTQGAGNDKTGRHYTGCQIYYYKNGKVVKMDTFKDGGRWLLLSKKDNAIKKYNKAIRLVENYHNLNEISARSANLLSNIYNNLDYTAVISSISYLFFPSFCYFLM